MSTFVLKNKLKYNPFSFRDYSKIHTYFFSSIIIEFVNFEVITTSYKYAFVRMKRSRIYCSGQLVFLNFVEVFCVQKHDMIRMSNRNDRTVSGNFEAAWNWGKFDLLNLLKRKKFQWWFLGSSTILTLPVDLSQTLSVLSSAQEIRCVSFLKNWTCLMPAEWPVYTSGAEN